MYGRFLDMNTTTGSVSDKRLRHGGSGYETIVGLHSGADLGWGGGPHVNLVIYSCFCVIV